MAIKDSRKALCAAYSQCPREFSLAYGVQLALPSFKKIRYVNINALEKGTLFYTCDLSIGAHLGVALTL